MDLAPLQTVGGASGNWCPSGAGTSRDLKIDLPLDQRLDDARSLVFDSEPLTESFEILGAPVVNLTLAVDKPVAYVAVRLNEVRPTGESSRVTYGILNRQTEEIELYRVRDYKLTQPVRLRLFGLGNILTTEEHVRRVWEIFRAAVS